MICGGVCQRVVVVEAREPLAKMNGTAATARLVMALRKLFVDEMVVLLPGGGEQQGHSAKQ